MNLTYPDIVTKYNKKQLLEFVRNGPIIYLQRVLNEKLIGKLLLYSMLILTGLIGRW